jgi:hypothetical protein
LNEKFSLFVVIQYQFEILLQLKAKDMDCGNNAIVHYSFQDEGSDTFKIGSNDGKMCLAQQLDHEAKDVHNVIVLATDKGDRHFSASKACLIRIFMRRMLILNEYFYRWPEHKHPGPC